MPANPGTEQQAIGLDELYYEPAHFLINRVQIFSSACARAVLSCWSMPNRPMTTMSSPPSRACVLRKLSRTWRLIRLRAVAARQFFFEIARPRRPCTPSLSRLRTVNHLSRLRVAFLNTRPNAAASSRRLSLRNWYGELPATAEYRSAAGIAYGVSLARPLARRRASTRRPAFVAMRARKPWVRARFNVLGWKVRFIVRYLLARGPVLTRSRKGGKGT